MSENPFRHEDSAGLHAQTAAALALGRLDGGLEFAAPPALRLFAARILRDTLVSSLRQEGHAFTEHRFHAWFAGLVTLSDTPPRQASPPRVLCEAILTELAHAGWEPLKDMALRLAPAFLAPQDLDVQDAHAHLHAVIRDARRLVEARLESLPDAHLAPLSLLHDDLRRSVRFAPPERPSPPVMHRPERWMREQPLASPPLWAVDLSCGEYLRRTAWLRPALPMAGVIRVEAIAEQDPGTARTRYAMALRDTAQGLCRKFAEAARLAQSGQQRPAGQRRTSRAPALFELLAGFGPLRSSQMESVLGATRLGVRGMIATLEGDGRIARTTIAGSYLYSASTDDRAGLAGSADRGEPSFSNAALDDFDASLARIDALLERGGKPGED